ncbi:MAG: ATP-binding cassette domain-containing protein [Planctomycetota bacterium]
MSAPWLRVEHLSYAVGGRMLIDDLDLVFCSDKITVLLGPNGAGKSLTLRLLHGLLGPTTGRVTWPGDRRIRNRQAFVFQRPVLLRCSVRANVEFALACRQVRRPQRKVRATQALERVGLLEQADQPARTLSVGEQQRLALARSWALDPDVIFLDEPTASLDPAAVGQVEEIIQAICDGGARVVMATHDLQQARRLAREICFLHRGRLIESSGSDVFFNEPRTAEAAAFLRSELFW